MIGPGCRPGRVLTGERRPRPGGRAGHRAARALTAGPVPHGGVWPHAGHGERRALDRRQDRGQYLAGPLGGLTLPVLFPALAVAAASRSLIERSRRTCARALTMRSAAYTTTSTPRKPPATSPATNTPPSAREILAAFPAYGRPDRAPACADPAALPRDQLQPASRRRSRRRARAAPRPAVPQVRGPAGCFRSPARVSAVRAGGGGQRNRHSQEGPIRLLADPDCVVCGPLAHIPASSGVPSCALPIIAAHPVSAQGPKSGIAKTCGPRPAPHDDADQAALQRAHDGTGPRPSPHRPNPGQPSPSGPRRDRPQPMPPGASVAIAYEDRLVVADTLGTGPS
jgi:hypothetical protein